MTLLIFFVIVAPYLVLNSAGFALTNNNPLITKSKEVIFLPSPRLKGDISLEDALGFQFSLGQRINDSFDVLTLAQLLWAAQGITHPPFRAAPSAGATYPLELHVVPRIPFDDLVPAEYIYNPDDHSLQQVASNNIFFDLINATQQSSTIKTSPVAMVITAHYERTTSKYGERGIRYVHLEVGHVLQNVIVQAKALYVDVQIIIDFNEAAVSSILATDATPLAIVVFWKTDTPQADNKRKRFNMKSDHLRTQMELGNSVSVEEAIAARRSIREYAPGDIPASHLTRLLEFSYGRRDPTNNQRVFHSLTGQYVGIIRLSISNVFGLKDGIYKYDDDINSLVLLNDETNNRDLLWQHGLKQNWILEAQVALVITINLTKLHKSSVPPEIQERAALFEIGMIAQNIYLECYVLGLGTVVVGAFNDNEIRSAVLANDDEIPVYIMPIGKVTTTRYGTSLPPALQFWSAIFSLLAIIFLYFAGLVMIPSMKKRFKRQATWLHYSFASVFFLFSLIHVVIAHGLWSSLLRNDFFTFLNKLIMVPIPPLQTYYTIEDMGLILARLIVVGFLVMLGLSVPFLFKISRNTKYRLFFLHKFLYWTLYGLLLIHAIVNGYLIASYSTEFILLTSIATLALVYLYFRRERLIQPKKEKQLEDYPPSDNLE